MSWSTDFHFESPSLQAPEAEVKIVVCLIVSLVFETKLNWWETFPFIFVAPGISNPDEANSSQVPSFHPIQSCNNEKCDDNDHDGDDDGDDVATMGIDNDADKENYHDDEQW